MSWASAVPAARSSLPAEPADSEVYRRALLEKQCVAHAIAAYDPDITAHDKSGQFGAFCYPLDRKGAAATLAGFAVLDEGTAYIAFRGTANLSNLLSDLNLSPTGHPRRHGGFFKCWTKLRPQVEQWLRQNRPKEVVLTGHSLGAAMAQLAALDLSPHWPLRAVMAFGSPLVGWRAFASTYDQTIIDASPAQTLGAITTAFGFKSDFVPHFLLPRLGCKAVGSTICIDENGRLWNSYVPRYQEAARIAHRMLAGPDSPGIPLQLASIPGSKAILRPSTARLGGSIDAFSNSADIAPPPRLNLQTIIDTVRPSVAHLMVFPQVLAAVLALGAAIAFFFSFKFLRRDLGYHSRAKAYGAAIERRFALWRPFAYEKWGEKLLWENKLADAIAYFSGAIELAEGDAVPGGQLLKKAQPATWSMRVNRAAAYSAQGDVDAAIKDLTAVVEANPSNQIMIAAHAGSPGYVQLIARERRALVYETAGRFNEAMEDYSAILACRPEQNLALLMEQAQRALPEYMRLVDQRVQAFRDTMAKTWEWARCRRAACAFELKDYAVTASEATAAIGLNPDSSGAFQLRGAAYARAGQRQEALQDFTRAIEIDPSNACSYYARAHTRMLSGYKVLSNGDGSHKATIETHMQERDPSLVEQDLRKTLELDPSHDMARQLLQALVDGRPAEAGKLRP